MTKVKRRVLGPNGTMQTVDFEIKSATETEPGNPELVEAEETLMKEVGENLVKEDNGVKPVGELKPLAEMTVKELKANAEALGLKFKKTAKKAELIELLNTSVEDEL